MYRLGYKVDDEWVPHTHKAVFDVGDRIVAGVPYGDPTIFGALIESLTPPFHLLYVLHTPRGEAEPGRYQSPSLTLGQVRKFLDQFGAFFSADGRFDLWAYSPADDATLVWDRHNLLYGYGPLGRIAFTLASMRYMRGRPEVPAAHEHYYRAEFDHLARGVIDAFDWSHAPLQPEDEQ
jgi:hypothetical protein